MRRLRVMTAGTASEHGRDREGRSDGDSDAAHQFPAYLTVFKPVLARMSVLR